VSPVNVASRIRPIQGRYGKDLNKEEWQDMSIAQADGWRGMVTSLSDIDATINFASSRTPSRLL